MQCKDIDTAAVLAFIGEHGGIGCTLFQNEDGSPCNERSIWHAMPTGIAHKLAVAKLKMMKRARLIDGCPCGCRGDWELTQKGRRRAGLPTDEQIRSEFVVRQWRGITAHIQGAWVTMPATLSAGDPYRHH